MFFHNNKGITYPCVTDRQTLGAWAACVYTRNEKYTKIVLSIEFAVTNGLNTL